MFAQVFSAIFWLSNKKIKSSLYSQSRGITPKRVTHCGAHLRSLAPGQHSFKETLQRRRAVGDTVPIWATWNLNPRLAAPIAYVRSATELTAGYLYLNFFN